jgi:hypothetical protein
MGELSEDLDEFIWKVLTGRQHVIAVRDNVSPELIGENRDVEQRDENNHPPYSRRWANKAAKA